MNNIKIAGFQWDKGNREKCQKHGVSIAEIEFVFLHEFAAAPDEIHSETEYRFQAIGMTEEGRHLFIVFTLRQQEGEAYIRPISARYMHQKEVAFYEKNSRI